MNQSRESSRIRAVQIALTNDAESPYNGRSEICHFFDPGDSMEHPVQDATALLQHFAASKAIRTPPEATGADGYTVQQIIEAMYRSSDSGCEVKIE